MGRLHFAADINDERKEDNVKEVGLHQKLASMIGIDSGPTTWDTSRPITYRYNRAVRIRKAPPYPRHVAQSIGSLSWSDLPYVFMARINWLPFPGFTFRTFLLAIVLTALTYAVKVSM